MDDQKGYELDAEKQRAIDGVLVEDNLTAGGSVGTPVDVAAIPDAPEPPPPNEPDGTPSEPEEPAAEGEGDEG